jgi:hypothetical protein
MDDAEALAAKAKDMEETGKQRYGEHWGQAISAISRNMPRDVNGADVLKEVLKRPDPAGLLFAAGREALIAEASEGNFDSERTYAKMRQEEREAYRISRGRG